MRTSTFILGFKIGLLSLLIVLALGSSPKAALNGVSRAAGNEFGVNLLRNSGFEEGMSRPTGWEWTNADWALRDQRSPYEGTVSGLLFAADEEKEMTWLQRDVPLLAGARYVISGRIRSDAPAVAVIGVDWTSQGGNEGQRLHRGIGADGGWHRIELEFVATDTGPATVVFGGVVHGSVWWDDVSLRRVDDRPQQLAAQWERLVEEHGEVYTGLIVDARGLGLRRGMSPKIVDERGRVVYAGMEADRSVVIGRGLVSYLFEPNDALKHSRLAVNEQFPHTAPLIVSATALADDPIRASVVISVADAERIQRELEKYDFLGRYAVVFILGDAPQTDLSGAAW